MAGKLQGGIAGKGDFSAMRLVHAAPAITATDIVRGLTPSGVKPTARSLVQDTVPLCGDLGYNADDFEMQLGALKDMMDGRLAEDQRKTAIMVAGAILNGAQGVALGSLLLELNRAVDTTQGRDALASRIAEFHNGANTSSGELFNKLHAEVRLELCGLSRNLHMDTAVFLAGAAMAARYSQAESDLA